MLSRLMRAILLLAATGLQLVPFMLPGFGMGLALAAGPAYQDIPEPPPLAETVFESALTGPDLFEARTCPTGAASGDYVDEGFRLRVRGRCVSDAPSANLPLPAPRVTMADNDISVDFKVVTGAQRAGLNLYARVKDSANLTSVYLNVGAGKAEVFRREAGQNRILATRGALTDVFDPSDWNRLSLRLRGTEAWVLLNDEPILYTVGVPDAAGGIGIAVAREGNVADTAEVGVVFRDLALSTLGDPAEEPEE